MQPYEISYLIEEHNESGKEKWEMYRGIIHAVISSQSAKPVKQTNIMKFDWDKDGGNNDKGVTKEDDIKRLKEKIKKM